MDGLQRLMQAKMVMQVPRHDGDIERGKQLYGEQCAVCHGREGQGRVTKPPLAGQHTEYLLTQIALFRKGKRGHPDTEELFLRTTPRDMDDILAYMSVLDD
jgi:cytochrome c553